jgi:deoxyhypusine synthase
MYKNALSGVLEEYYEIDLKDSWMYAAAEKIYPLLFQDGKIVQWVIFLLCYQRRIKVSTMKSGIEYMTFFSRLVS